VPDQRRAARVAFCGPSEPTEQERQDAEAIGRGLASAGGVILCGGLGGSMEAACRGAKQSGGLTIGILPGYDSAGANRWVDISICTGMGHSRNVILVASADVVVACGGGWGTLSEIALAIRLGRPIVVQGAWGEILRIPVESPDTGHSRAAIMFSRSAEETIESALGLIGNLDLE
jgi:uncharacterized protein (TIGR00725 family)